MKTPDRHFHEVHVDSSDAALARFARALFVVGGTVTSSFSLAPEAVRTKSRRVTVFAMVGIPAGREATFAEMARVELKRATEVGT